MLKDKNFYILIVVIVLFFSGIYYFDYLKTKEVSAWYSTGGTWGYRKVIDINPQKVASTTGITLFPMLFSVTDPNLKHTSFGGNVASSTGKDIVFTNSDAVTKIPYEIELYASTTGQVVLWVRIPFLSSTTTTRIYMYYGNNSATDQEDAVNVWYNYLGVYHMKENPGTTCSSTKEVCDSSWNAYHGDAIGSMNSADQVTGKIGYGIDFDGSNDQIQFTDNSDLDGISQLYISAWAKQSGQGTNDLVVSKFFGGSSIGWSLQTGSASCGDADDMFFYSNSTSAYGCTTANLLSTSAYSYWAYVYNGGLSGNSNRSKIYHNGIEQTQSYTGTAPATLPSTTYKLFISGSDDNIFEFPGIIDEVRISTSTRTTQYIQTEFNNQNDPLSFYTYGVQEVPNRVGASEKVRSGGTTNLTNPSIKVRGGVKFR